LSFKLVYYSQQDPQWKSDLLGFGDPGDTIGMYGCALTSVAMLVSGHGYTETPQTLNQKLKSKNGFVSSGIRWDVVAQVHPQITLRESVNCETTDAPLARINASLDAGQPVVVRVDSSPAPGLQWHYVMLYARKGTDDYLMLDPYPYSPGTTKEDALMARYSRGNPLKRAIQQVLFYQCSTASGTTGTPQPQPTTDSVSDGPRARVKAELTWGLNVRSSPDTSSMANVVASVSAGTELILLDADGASKIGTQQWVRVREPGGKEGYAAAWYLDLVSSGAPASSTESTPGPVSGAPASTPAPSAPSQQMDPNKKYLVVSDIATELRQKASNSAPSQMHLTPGMLLIVIEPYAKAKGKLGQQNQWIYVRGSNKKLGYVLSQFVKLP
jgi:SH3 domain-containing protein/peptidase C39-like protein